MTNREAYKEHTGLMLKEFGRWFGSKEYRNDFEKLFVNGESHDVRYAMSFQLWLDLENTGMRILSDNDIKYFGDVFRKWIKNDTTLLWDNRFSALFDIYKFLQDEYVSGIRNAESGKTDVKSKFVGDDTAISFDDGYITIFDTKNSPSCYFSMPLCVRALKMMIDTIDGFFNGSGCCGILSERIKRGKYYS